jgi:hypothetical protein
VEVVVMVVEVEGELIVTEEDVEDEAYFVVVVEAIVVVDEDDVAADVWLTAAGMVEGEGVFLGGVVVGDGDFALGGCAVDERIAGVCEDDDGLGWVDWERGAFWETLEEMVFVCGWVDFTGFGVGEDEVLGRGGETGLCASEASVCKTAEEWKSRDDDGTHLLHGLEGGGGYVKSEPNTTVTVASRGVEEKEGGERRRAVRCNHPLLVVVAFIQTCGITRTIVLEISPLPCFLPTRASSLCVLAFALDVRGVLFPTKSTNDILQFLFVVLLFFYITVNILGVMDMAMSSWNKSLQA